MNRGDLEPRHYSLSELLGVYKRHPISAANILKQLERSGGGRSIKQHELEMPRQNSGISDQNHIGGVEAVVDLGLASGITDQSYVLDIGSGIGGSARALALRFGCRVHCIDVSPERTSDAKLLTQLVGLDHLVTFECGDASSLNVPQARYDVLWGQSAWCHFYDLRGLLQRWSPALVAGGRVAFEDSRLRRAPVDLTEEGILCRLQHQWKSYLLQTCFWDQLFSDLGMSVCLHQDLTPLLKRNLQFLIENNPKEVIDPKEYLSWCDATALVDSGLIGYGRIVGKKAG